MDDNEDLASADEYQCKRLSLHGNDCWRALRANVT